MGDEEILNAKTFTLKYNTNENVWDVLPDNEYLKWDDIMCEGETWEKGIELNDDTDLNAVFFDDFPLY